MDKLSFLKTSKLKKEYQNLFSSLNHLKSALKEEKAEMVPELFNQFLSSLKTCFEKEEKLMEEFKYSDIIDHKKEHDLLQKKLEYFFLTKESKEKLLNYELIEILEEILIDHIIKFDKPFNFYLTTKIDTYTEFLSKNTFLDKLQDFIEKEGTSKDITLVLIEIEEFHLLSLTLGSHIGELLLKDFSVFLKNYFDLPNIIS
jgi:hemerythrin-like metal-binding protein